MVKRPEANPSRGEVWWADLGVPAGSEPGFRRPVVIVQSDAMNASRIGTIICVPLTSNPDLAAAPGNVELSRTQSGLTKDSIANVAQIIAISRRRLEERVGRIPSRSLETIYLGLDIVLGR